MVRATSARSFLGVSVERVDVELEVVERVRARRHGRLPVQAPLVLLQPRLNEHLHVVFETVRSGESVLRRPRRRGYVVAPTPWERFIFMAPTRLREYQRDSLG